MEQFSGATRAIRRDLNDIKNWDSVTVVHFPEQILFAHFYTYFYLQDKELLKATRRNIREFVRYRPETFYFAKLILDSLPSSFSTLHIRRGDFRDLFLVFYSLSLR